MSEEVTYSEAEAEPEFIFDEEGVKHFECVFKHLCAAHGLGWEWITTITSSQLMQSNPDFQSGIYRKTVVISSITSELEEILDEFVREFMLKKVADATNNISVSSADIRQFIWQYGHLVLAEEHFADYTSLFVKRLQKANSDKESEKIKEKILKCSSFLYVTRLMRKKYFTEFLRKVSAKRRNQVK